MNLKELQERVSDLIKSEGESAPCAWMIWLSDDVLSKANEKDIILEMDQVGEILSNIQDDANAEFGITWDTIDNAIDDYCEVKNIDKTFIEKEIEDVDIEDVDIGLNMD